MPRGKESRMTGSVIYTHPPKEVLENVILVPVEALPYEVTCNMLVFGGPIFIGDHFYMILQKVNKDEKTNRKNR